MNVHHEEWLWCFPVNLHGRAARHFASSSSWEQMITEATYIDGGVIDLVPTNVPDVVGVWVGLPVTTSDLSAVFMDVLEQLTPHLVIR